MFTTKNHAGAVPDTAVRRRSDLHDQRRRHVFPESYPGTAAAFGGVTDGLQQFGIPVACCSDGPSGIRMDCGTMAYALPNGTLLACTFDPELVEELYEMEGMELRKNKIDSLLGPGINIHRNPLNGRNFEYFPKIRTSPAPWRQHS